MGWRHRGGRGSWGPFSWDMDDRSGPPGRGQRRGRVFDAAELRLLLLGLIGESPRHGYEAIKAIEELSGGHYAPSAGVIYPALNLLADEGLIEQLAGEGRGRAYGLTAEGAAELDGRAEEYQQLLGRLRALAEEGERHRAPPLRRAIANLFMALKGRASAGDYSPDMAHQIAEILDEAARKIERL
ncbi:MAG: helix-turn-helix transcriptional regulator [Proteobacteria bacterium]|nr:helix-turn-helix transcriptional regulator [Pseudomonadota bacterium]